MTNLPTPWMQFFHSGFKYRPVRRMSALGTYYRTNPAKWAKQ